MFRKAVKEGKRSPRRAFGVAAALVMGFVVIAGATAARPAIRDVEYISEGLISTAIAYEIGDKCSSIDARLVAGVNFLWSLREHAAQLGYTDDEIDAFVDSKDEQRRLEAIARSRLRQMGAVEGEWDTYCTVGATEIAGNTTIGQLLR